MLGRDGTLLLVMVVAFNVFFHVVKALTLYSYYVDTVFCGTNGLLLWLNVDLLGGLIQLPTILPIWLSPIEAKIVPSLSGEL